MYLPTIVSGRVLWHLGYPDQALRCAHQAVAIAEAVSHSVSLAGALSWAAALHQLRGEVGRFYAVTAFINVGLGVITGIIMMLWGMPTPYVWGIMAALLNFVPYAGPSITFVIVIFAAVSNGI